MESLRHDGKVTTPIYRLPVDTNVGNSKIPISETVTLTGKNAAGATGIVSLARNHILNNDGDKIGSYWGHNENKVLRTGKYLQEKNVIPGGTLVSLTETALSAAVVISNADLKSDQKRNLEDLFESSGTGRFVIRVFDKTSPSANLFGWIGGVAKSTDTYTFSIYNSPALSAQSWVGDLSAFNNASLGQAEIYSFESSFRVSGTILTREVNYNPLLTDIEQLARMSNGDYAVDYENGRLLFKRADTGATVAVTYNVFGPSGGSTTSTPTYTTHSITGIADGKKTITTAGTAETLVASSTPCKRVTIQAYASNAQRVAIGGSTVDASATAGTGRGIVLAPDESFSLDIDDLVDIYLDVLGNGEGVRFTYLT